MCLISVSCNPINIQTELREFVNSEIIFPTTLNSWYTGDTLQFKGHKLIYYIDSTGCTSCRLNRLYEDLNILSEMDMECKILSIIAPNRTYLNTLSKFFDNHCIYKNLYIDTKNNFFSLNHNLPKDTRYHSFLLDKNNRVVLVGNPLASNAM